MNSNAITMNVDELDQVLRGMTGQKDTKNQLRTISHWIKRIKDAKDSEYVMYEDSELKSVLKLANLKLVEVKEGTKEEKIGTVYVRLTDSGRDLYKDFFRTGYFLKA